MIKDQKYIFLDIDSLYTKNILLEWFMNLIDQCGDKELYKFLHEKFDRTAKRIYKYGTKKLAKICNKTGAKIILLGEDGEYLYKQYREIIDHPKNINAISYDYYTDIMKEFALNGIKVDDYISMYPPMNPKNSVLLINYLSKKESRLYEFIIIVPSAAYPIFYSSNPENNRIIKTDRYRRSKFWDGKSSPKDKWYLPIGLSNKQAKFAIDKLNGKYKRKGGCKSDGIRTQGTEI